jgi:hypothetical protein
MSMKLTITTAALIAALAVPALAASHGRHATRMRAVHYVQYNSARASVEGVFDADARPYNTPPQFAGYPTDYLMNRFGDRQMQGR